MNQALYERTDLKESSFNRATSEYHYPVLEKLGAFKPCLVCHNGRRLSLAWQWNCEHCGRGIMPPMATAQGQ